MGILFRLRNAQLRQPQLGDILPKDIFQCFTGIGHFHVRHTGIVTSGADELNGEKALFPLKSGKVRIHQGAGDLPCPIRTEVHENHGVIGLNLRVLHTDHRSHELVGDLLIIGTLHGIQRVGDIGGFPVDHSRIGFFRPIPVGVPIHCIVSALNGDDLGAVLLAIRLHLCHEAFPRSRRHITAV